MCISNSEHARRSAAWRSVIAYRRWFFTTLGLLCAIALLVFALSYATDLFGVFRDTRGRNLSVHQNERTGKYLLNQEYVPANFDAILIGSSQSANWDVAAVHGMHVYNESIDGGNAAEEKLLVDQALRKGHFRYALCLVTPWMTYTHTLNEGGMGAPKRVEALGSVNMLREGWDAGLVKLHLQQPRFFADGSKVLATPKWEHPEFPTKVLILDDEAVRDYQEILGELRKRGVRLIFIQPPFVQPIVDQTGTALNENLRESHLMELGEPLIDFKAEKFRSFREHAVNFDDGVHLNAAAVLPFSRLLDREVQRVLSKKK